MKEYIKYFLKEYVIYYLKEFLKVFWLPLVILVAICIFAGPVFKSRHIAPTFSINGTSEIDAGYGRVFEDPGVAADYDGKDISDQVVIKSNVDTSALGDYTVKYKLKYKGYIFKGLRTVHVVDDEAPILKLTGDEKVVVQDFSQFSDPGCTAEDKYDGTLTASIKVREEQVKEDEKHIFYSITDAAGNTAEVMRKVFLPDDVAPVISLKGEDQMEIYQGDKWVDPGYTAEDNQDGDITDRVVVSGPVGIYKPGTYTITYSVYDERENLTEVSREVKVVETHKNPENAVYLTFDDGPTKEVTPKILDVLKNNNAKATFFILGYTDETKPIVQRIIDEGHTVAIHGYEHDYEKIYSSTDAFMENVNKLHDKLKQDFGYDATIMRFPGGSTNTVSNKYTPGIMTQLVSIVTDAGYMYVDWDIDSGDAKANTVDAEEILAYLQQNTDEFNDYRTGSMTVLMHDAKTKTTGPEALQAILDFYAGLGKEFYAYDMDTTPSQFSLSQVH